MVFLRRLHLLGVFSFLLFIFLLNQLILGPQRSSFEDNSALAHEEALEEDLFEPAVKDDNDDALSQAQIMTVDNLPIIKPLDCVRTKPVLGVSPLICIKSEKEDRFISFSLLHEGIWEEEIVTNVLKVASLYKVMMKMLDSLRINFFLRMPCFWTWGQTWEFTLCLWLNFDILLVIAGLVEWLLWTPRQTTLFLLLLFLAVPRQLNR